MFLWVSLIPSACPEREGPDPDHQHLAEPGEQRIYPPEICSAATALSKYNYDGYKTFSGIRLEDSENYIYQRPNIMFYMFSLLRGSYSSVQLNKREVNHAHSLNFSCEMRQTICQYSFTVILEEDVQFIQQFIEPLSFVEVSCTFVSFISSHCHNIFFFFQKVNLYFLRIKKVL